MLKSGKGVVIGVLLALGTFQSVAQTAFTTNWVQLLTLNLQGLSQGPSRTTSSGDTITTTRPVRITTRQVINALGQALGVSFSPRAKLLVVTPVDGGGSVYIVRDIVNGIRVEQNVSAFFSQTTVGTKLTRTITGADGRSSGTEFSNEVFSYGPLPDGTRYDLQGTATASYFNDAPRAMYIGVYGAGTTDQGAPAIVSGMIAISGPRLERIGVQP